MKSYKIILENIKNLPYQFYTLKEIETTYALASAYKPFLKSLKETDMH